MKLVICIHSLGQGGAERVSVTLANYWAQQGRSVTLVTLAPVSEDRYELAPSVARVALELASESAGLLGGVRANLRRIGALRKLLRRLQPDAVIAMMSTMNVLLAFARRPLGAIRVIGSERIHPPRLPLGRVWTWLRAFSYRWLDAVVVLTSDSAQWVRTHTSAREVTIIPNPALWPLPVQEPKVDPGSVGVPGRRRLLAVGRLDAQKGFDLLLDVFARLVGVYPDWELVIVGEGSLREALQQQRLRLGLDNAVYLPGSVGNAADWYAAADLFVMSSRFEGFPNTLTEAMASGLAVVSFDCETGPRDLIRPEVDGLLVRAGNCDELEAALHRLMGDADLRDRFADRAIEVRERFALDRIAQAWDHVLFPAGGV